MKPSTVRLIRTCSIGIMTIAAVISYWHQHKLLQVWGVDPLGALAVPLTVDLLAIICTVVAHADVNPSARRWALWILGIAVAVSGSANWLAGGSVVGKVANVWTVVAILLAEIVAAKTKAAPPAVNERRSAAARKAAATRKANAAKAKARSRKPRTPVQEIEALSTAAPVSPAPVGR